MDKPKVLILYNKLFHYRIPIWNLLAEKCDLTVAYSFAKVEDVKDCNFSVRYLPVKTIKNRFVLQKENIRKLAKKFDVVIAYGDIAWLKYSTLPWFNKQKVIFWSLGISASYDKGFDEHKEWDKIRKFFYDKADALAFYTTYPIEKYAQMGIKREKMFEAPNTVEVHPTNDCPPKDSILFIGTLYRQKGVQELLNSYLKLKTLPELPQLNIIGDGPDFESILSWIKENDLQNHINLCGAIYDIDEKAQFFARAYACISPKQAGLSVLESMGYGVPFVTTKNAITGGEMLNIHNGVDGVILSNINELTDVIRDISLNPFKYEQMGIAARKYYNNNRTPQHMADGLWKAICYVLEN